LLSGTSTEFTTVQTLTEFFKRVLKQVPPAARETKRRKIAAASELDEEVG